MKIVAIRALHMLALQPVPLDVLRTYNVGRLVLGKDYILFPGWVLAFGGCRHSGQGGY